MPELPEVEVVRAGLERVVTGRQVAAVQVLDARSLRRFACGETDFVSSLVGQTMLAPRRRGKFLWVPLEAGDALLAHLGMSGQFRSDHPEAALPRNTRILIDFADGGNQLRFVDQRLFGGLAVSSGGAELPAEVAHIAPDPFDPEYDAATVAGRIRARHSTIKRTILDQSLVSGIGNIYADEALWRAHVHFDTPTQAMSLERIRRVLDAAAAVMSESLAARGTSFDALYVDVAGESGYFARSLAVYGREGQPCLRCGAPIVREHFQSRSSYRCPHCQRRPPAH